MTPWVAVRPQVSAWNAWGRNALLLATTAASVYLAGARMWGMADARLAVGLLAILLSHEMGHYLACRYYRVDATLPFFIPSLWLPVGGGVFTPLSPVGTFGAFIRIRGPIPHRKALFDIGIAGPLAGFLVCLPVLVLGLVEARIVTQAPSEGMVVFGDPLLLQWLAALLIGDVPPGSSIHLGPFGLAAWFGMFVTALNMIPVGQLDGGHVTYALLRDKATLVSRFGWWVCVALVYFSPTWILWAVLLRAIGRRHPPTLNDAAPLGRARVAIGVLGFLVLAVCFVPEPIVGSWSQVSDGLDSLLELILH